MGLLFLSMDVEKKQLKSVSCSLKKFTCTNDYITVTEWANGEGWDISIENKLISLHSGELQAINYLTTMLDYDYD